MKLGLQQSVFSQFVRPTVIELRSHSAFSPTRTMVQRRTNEWSRVLSARFDEITSLPLGWNGYRSKPVSFTNARFAADLIERIYADGVPAPEIVPGTDGTLQVEWHINGYDVELDILGANDVAAWRREISSGVEEEEYLTADFTVVAKWMQDLVATERGNAIQAAV